VSAAMQLLRPVRSIPFRVRLRARLIRLALLLSAITVIATMVGGCAAATNITIPGTGPLVTITARGGMCPVGAGESAVILEGDGRVHATGKPPNELGTVSANQLATLTAAIAATDYTAMRAKKFTGSCPINFDGQELIFDFATPTGTQRIASCEVNID